MDKEPVRFKVEGPDSTVAQFKNRAIKIYNQTGSEIDRKVTQYSEITNRAAGLLLKKPWIMDRFIIAGHDYPLRVFVNPVDRVRTKDGFSPKTSSLFIPGPTIDDLKTKSVLDPKGEKLMTSIRSGSDIAQREKYEEWIRLFYGGQKILPQNIYKMLSDLSSYLNSNLGTEGININERNVKLLFDPGTNSLKMVVTDISTNLLDDFRILP